MHSECLLTYLGCMTVKQARILEVATALFATDGYDATPTSKIASEAGVSEGLIFRHFKNKQGLLDSISAMASVAADNQLSALEDETDMAQRIQLAIDQAFAKTKGMSHYNAIRTQLGATGTSFGDVSPEGLRESPTAKLDKLLAEAFKAMNFENPATEAKFLRCSLAGIQSAINAGDLSGTKKLKAFMQNMYA